MVNRVNTRWTAFWLALGFLLLTYLVFPLLVLLRGLFVRRPVIRGSATPRVSIIVTAYNEAAVIVRKLDNLFALDYPADQMEVIVASDGSDDGTNELASGYGHDVRLLTLPRQGKNRTLNDAVAGASGEILVMTDADTMLAPDTLRHLVAPFSDPSVGGVAGDHRFAVSSAGPLKRVAHRLKRVLREYESAAGSVTSAEGPLYAIRRELFSPVPPSVTDDFYVSVQIPAQHYRLVYEPRATAYEVVGTPANAVFQRKVRIATRALYARWVVRRLLNPFEYGFFALQLLFHKVARKLVAVPVLLLALTAPSLWQRGRLYRVAALAQLALHGMALLGFLLRRSHRRPPKPLALLLAFERSNAVTLVALAGLLRGERYNSWTPQRAPKAEAREAVSSRSSQASARVEPDRSGPTVAARG